MNNYVAIQEFSMPQIGKRIHVGDTVGKVLIRSSVYIDGSEYDDHAAFDWVGTLNSAPFLTYVGIVPDPPYAGIYTGVGGSQALISGQSYVTVSGLSLGFVPSSVLVTVQKPNGSSSNIFGTVRQNTITSAGFTVDFQTPIPTTGYVLSYFIGPLQGQLAPSTDFVGGHVPVGNGALTVTVAQAFGFLPTTVVVSVIKPDAGGMNIFATVKMDSVTATGFIVDLSAAPASTGYFLDFFVK